MPGALGGGRGVTSQRLWTSRGLCWDPGGLRVSAAARGMWVPSRCGGPRGSILPKRGGAPSRLQAPLPGAWGLLTRGLVASSLSSFRQSQCLLLMEPCSLAGCTHSSFEIIATVGLSVPVRTLRLRTPSGEFHVGGLTPGFSGPLCHKVPGAFKHLSAFTASHPGPLRHACGLALHLNCAWMWSSLVQGPWSSLPFEGGHHTAHEHLSCAMPDRVFCLCLAHLIYKLEVVMVL